MSYNNHFIYSGSNVEAMLPGSLMPIPLFLREEGLGNEGHNLAKVAVSPTMS